MYAIGKVLFELSLNAYIIIQTRNKIATNTSCFTHCLHIAQVCHVSSVEYHIAYLTMALQSENAGLTALFRNMRRWGRLTEIVVQRLTHQLVN